MKNVFKLGDKEFEEATKFISESNRFKKVRFTTKNKTSRWILVSCWLFEGLMLSNWLMDYFDTSCDGMAMEELSLTQRLDLGFD
jgi:hypothetical protein